VQAAPAEVSGDQNTPVGAELTDLAQGVTYFYRVRATGLNGSSLGEVRTFDVASLSGLIQQYPPGVPALERQGSVVVTLYMMTDDDFESTVVTINSQSTMPVGTGLTAASGDEFIVSARGAMKVLTTWPSIYQGWFAPQGTIRLQRAGQQVDYPFGAVIGTFDAGLSNAFYIGDGGGWSAQPADVGDELTLGVNMSDADLAGAQGAMIVQVIRIRESQSAIGPEGQTISFSSMLGNSRPNPMNPAGTIPFSVAEEGPVRLRIYDASGRIVRTLVDDMRAAGDYDATWDGRDDQGRAVASGNYFYQLSTANGSQTKKLSLMK
jgi:hypothetical protein